MVVEGAGRKVGELGAIRRAGGSGDVAELEHRIAVGDVKVGAHQRHAERRVELVDEDGLGLRNAVTIAIAQQNDAIGRGCAGPGPALHLFRQPVLQTFIGLGRRVGLGHQHVAVGQHVQPAWVVELGGEGGHADARRTDGLGTRRPTFGAGDLHGGNQAFVDRWQLRMGAERFCRRRHRTRAGVAWQCIGRQAEPGECYADE